jgi:hypothetical protein
METEKRKRGRPKKQITIDESKKDLSEQIGTIAPIENEIIEDEEIPPIKENKKIIKKVIKKEEQKEKSFFEKLYNL